MSIAPMKTIVGFALLLAFCAGCAQSIVVDTTLALAEDGEIAGAGHWDPALVAKANAAGVLQFEALLRANPGNKEIKLKLANAYLGYATLAVAEELDEADLAGELTTANLLSARLQKHLDRAVELLADELGSSEGKNVSVKAGNIFIATLLLRAQIDMSSASQGLQKAQAWSKHIASPQRLLIDALVELADGNDGAEAWRMATSQAGGQGLIAKVVFARYILGPKGDEDAFLQTLESVLESESEGLVAALAQQRAARYLRFQDEIVVAKDDE